jgi:hypothetical protein
MWKFLWKIDPDIRIMKGDDKYTRSVQCIVFMITGGRIPSIKEMTMDEFGLKSMVDIDPMDLRMSSKMWEKRRLVPMGKSIEHNSYPINNFLQNVNLFLQMTLFPA